MRHTNTGVSYSNRGVSLRARAMRLCDTSSALDILWGKALGLGQHLHDIGVSYRNRGVSYTNTGVSYSNRGVSLGGKALGLGQHLHGVVTGAVQDALLLLHLPALGLQNGAIQGQRLLVRGVHVQLELHLCLWGEGGFVCVCVFVCVCLCVCVCV